MKDEKTTSAADPVNRPRQPAKLATGEEQARLQKEAAERHLKDKTEEELRAAEVATFGIQGKPADEKPSEAQPESTPPPHPEPAQ